MTYRDRIAECNRHDLTGFRPFRVAGAAAGWVRHAFADRLRAFPDVFAVQDDHVAMQPALDDFAARSQAMAVVLAQLRADGLIPGWRDELYPVTTAYGLPPLLQIERAAAALFGIRGYGVHMNGYVRDGDGIRMWVARRAADRPNYPGMLDNLVAGGQPIGRSLRDNLRKEAAEEASIPAELAAQAIPVGAVSYALEVPEGLKTDVLFCYDLALPERFAPRNVDGEIAEFALWPIARVAATVRDTADFKFNCNLVIIDFLIRHGVLDPEDPDYLAIVTGLRQ